jgi:CheY-like chemotaxis protein
MLKRILVLDDNQDILDIVNETLTYEQFEVQGTTMGSAVIPLMEEFAPDLVILDYRVADINGGEICKNIKSHPKFSAIPVIIFSAYINKDDELFAYGCNAVINKPFDLIELVDKVQSLIPK